MKGRRVLVAAAVLALAACGGGEGENTGAAAADIPSGAAVPRSCQSAAGPWQEGSVESGLPEPLDGASVAGRDALLALRESRGDALIVIRGGNFSGSDFRGARLHNVCFIETDLSGTDWRGADAHGVGFIRSNLSEANLAGARMPGVLLRNPDMTDVDASGADFSRGRIEGNRGGSFENLRLDRADLSGFRFDCSEIIMDDACPGMRSMSLRGANLTGASLHNWRFDAVFAGARLDRTEVGLRQLRDLADAELAGPLVLRGGDATVEIDRDDYRVLLPRIRDPWDDPAPFTPGRPPAWLRPGAVVLFVEPAVAFDPAFRTHALFRRLVPVIRGSAWRRLVVKVNADGTIDAAGEAIGPNAHLCSVGGMRLRLERATGWFSGPYKPADREPAEWRGRPMPVLRFWADRAEVHEGGHSHPGSEEDEPSFSDYVTCGARARFGPMVRLPVTDAEARAALEQLPPWNPVSVSRRSQPGRPTRKGPATLVAGPASNLPRKALRSCRSGRSPRRRCPPAGRPGCRPRRCGGGGHARSWG
ncbi:MAG TPA: pentapeptide repeat-containing protein [Allosphingosinicella sp.]|jgi:uncharacterized protein YjbI with pentapeptide repeats